MGWIKQARGKYHATCRDHYPKVWNSVDCDNRYDAMEELVKHNTTHPLTNAAILRALGKPARKGR